MIPKINTELSDKNASASKQGVINDTVDNTRWVPGDNSIPIRRDGTVNIFTADLLGGKSRFEHKR